MLSTLQYKAGWPDPWRLETAQDYWLSFGSMVELLPPVTESQLILLNIMRSLMSKEFF